MLGIRVDSVVVTDAKEETMSRAVLGWSSVMSCFCLLTFSSQGRAQLGASQASAEALFNEGVSLVASGSFAEGCRKFEASQALDATLGTELRLADCYERLGRTASAWALFKHAQGMAHVQNQTDRESLAAERAQALEQRLAFLSLTLAGPAPPGLQIEQNGRALPLASLGVALPVDPGQQLIRVSAPGYRAWSQAVEVAATPRTLSLQIPRLVAEPKPAAAVGAARKDEPSNTQRHLGMATSAVGLVSLVVGGGLGWHAKSEGERSKRDEFCPNDDHNGCTSEGVSIRQNAQSFATASTVTFAVGGVLLASGIVLWSTAPARDQARSTPRWQLRGTAGLGAVGTSLRGTF